MAGDIKEFVVQKVIHHMNNDYFHHEDRASETRKIQKQKEKECVEKFVKWIFSKIDNEAGKCKDSIKMPVNLKLNFFLQNLSTSERGIMLNLGLKLPSIALKMIRESGYKIEPTSDGMLIISW